MLARSSRCLLRVAIEAKSNCFPPDFTTLQRRDDFFGPFFRYFNERKPVRDVDGSNLLARDPCFASNRTNEILWPQTSFTSGADKEADHARNGCATGGWLFSFPTVWPAARFAISRCSFVAK